MPLTISTLLSSSKPVAAAARPVNAFSSEITTGMSAPPIGSTNRTPKTRRAADERPQQPLVLHARDERDPAARHARKSAALTNCWPAYVIGRPPISSCSLANAIIEPANEIEPISAESTIASEMSTFGAPGSGQDAVQLGERDERRRAAADAVEERHHLRHRGHLHAPRRDRAEAAADQHAERDRPVVVSPLLANVTAIATSMPAAPIWLPRRACAGLDRKRNARMKVTIVTRYSRFERL